MDPSLARRRSVVTEQPARAAAGAILRRRRGGNAREVEGLALRPAILDLGMIIGTPRDEEAGRTLVKNGLQCQVSKVGGYLPFFSCASLKA
jgi:hypothetical protein